MDVVSQFVSYLADSWGRYLGGVAALGVFSMAILQTVKDLLPIRRSFQRAFLRHWFARKCGGAAHVLEIEHDLINLSTDGEAAAFYDLPIEQLCGQISAAAQVVIENPGVHGPLLRCLASRAPKSALDQLIDVQQPLRRTFAALKEDESAKGRAELESLADAKARVMHQIQRNIDALQIAASYRWKLWFQIASFATCYVIAYVATGSQKDWPASTRVFVALAAGFLAPVARDLQAKLQQVK